jgi:molybdate transport system substrate-binding protein
MHFVARFVLAAAFCLAAAAPHAADIKVLTAGAFKPVVLDVVPAFEKATGHKVTVENDTAGALAKRVAGGEAFDLIILTNAGIDDLAKSGKVAADAKAPVARVGIGVAVKTGAPMPEVSTVAGFRAALLGAKKVAYIDPAAGGSSGIYLAKLFEKLGIADEIKAKAVLVPGGLTAARVVNGEADIAVQQMSELLVVPGATFVGPIPGEVQNWTIYAAGVSSAARDPAATRALLAALTGPNAVAAMKGKGLEAP